MYSRVYIEISNICNLQCHFCPEVERDKKVMSLEAFTHIIGQLKGKTEEVAFHLMGEPLTHPQFPDFVEACFKIGLPINLTTNGTLLNHKNRRVELLHPGIRQINFSLQSFMANEKLGDLNTYLQTIFSFTQVALRERPDLYINYRLWNVGSQEEKNSQNTHYLRPIEEAFGLTVAAPQNVAFRKSKRLMGRLYLHYDSRFEWPSLKRPILQESGFCYGLDSHFAIHADGTVVPCCLDKEANIPLGSAANLSIALNSERAQVLKIGFQKRELKEELCKRCDYIKRFAKK